MTHRRPRTALASKVAATGLSVTATLAGVGLIAHADATGSADAGSGETTSDDIGTGRLASAVVPAIETLSVSVGPGSPITAPTTTATTTTTTTTVSSTEPIERPAAAVFGAATAANALSARAGLIPVEPSASSTPAGGGSGATSPGSISTAPPSPGTQVAAPADAGSADTTPSATEPSLTAPPANAPTVTEPPVTAPPPTAPPVTEPPVTAPPDTAPPDTVSRGTS